MSHRPTASAADIEWIDVHGDSQVYGYEVTVSDIAALEEPGDRRADGKLTREARHRIAAILSTHLRLLHAQTLAAHGAEPNTVTYRDCEGLDPSFPRTATERNSHVRNGTAPSRRVDCQRGRQ